jgi:putative DNA-invertase from lambdoid prophage Rac
LPAARRHRPHQWSRAHDHERGRRRRLEPNLLIERTQSDPQPAWAEGKKSGRRATLSDDQSIAVRAAQEAGESVSELARRYQTSRQTILRAKAAV